jgi:hypothetical protein
MRSRRAPAAKVQAVVGFAAGSDGRGIAYASLTCGSVKRILRVEFRAPSQGCAEHAAGYAALTAVTRALVRRGIARAHFVLADADFVDEIATGSGVGAMLALPYVRLRCSLNSLAEFSVASGATDDLTQRARAEVALSIAA